MLHKWSIEFPDSINPEWNYEGVFYELPDRTVFVYAERYYKLVAVQFSPSGKVLSTKTWDFNNLGTPHSWVISNHTPPVLICGKDSAFRLDSLQPLNNPPEKLFENYQQNLYHLEEDPFIFESYQIEHTTSFAFRCVDLINRRTIWKLALNGYLYHDIIQIPGTNLILICTAGHGGSVYAVNITNGKIQYEIKTNGTRFIILEDNYFFCYRIGKNGSLLKVDNQTGVILDYEDLYCTDIHCPLWRTAEREIITFSKVRKSKNVWQPVLSCYGDAIGGTVGSTVCK